MQAYNNIDQRIHQLSQTLAKFGRSFADHKTDDSHTNLYFDLVGKTIWGRWAILNNTAYILGLDLEAQEFKILNKNQESINHFEISGKTQASVEQEIATFLKENLKAEKDDFLKRLHFEIPAYSFLDKTVLPFEEDALSNWIKYRQVANDVCQLITSHLNVETETRIWPHHFDTGVYFETTPKLAIGFGWAMADSMVPDPYFYFSAYGLNGHQVDYKTTTPLTVGKWMITEHWKGGVLPMQEASFENCQTFIKETAAWAVKK